MNFINFNLKKFLLLALALALPLISINTQQSPLHQGWQDKPFSLLASLAQSSFFSFSDGVRGTTALYLNLVDIKKSNQKLNDENRELQTRLEVLAELQKENDRLNSLLEFKAKTKMDLVAARVMSKDLVSDHNTIQINKGLQHGLKAGQAVITTHGVVGHVFKPEAISSQILLITDRYSVVDGVISRSRARGIVEGKSTGACTLRYVEKSEDVIAGDIVVTSGLDNIYPKGFPVAIVDTVENKPYAVSLKVELRPLVDPDKVEEVFVILNAANEDLNERMAIKLPEPEEAPSVQQ